MRSTLFFVLGARARRAAVVVFLATTLVVGLVPAVRGVGDLLAPQVPVVTPPGTELVGLRTATTKTFATATPGQYRTKTFSSPVHFRNDFGLWDEIDTTLVPSVEPARFVTAGNSAILDVAADPTNPDLVRYRLDDEHSIGFRLAGARPGAPAVPAGPKVTYGGILPHVDLRLTTTNQGVKEELVLASPAAADRFVFPLALDSLTASVNEAGEVVYRDADGRERAVTPNGFMEDANVDPHTDSGAVSRDVRYAVIPWEGGQALEVTVDRTWLDDPARVYPVVVDPTYWLSTTWSDDTFVMSTTTADNSWLHELKVGTYNSGTNIAISFMNFDVNGLRGKIIDSARFEVWNNHSWSCQARGMGVYRVTQGWGGRTMTGYPGASLGERVAWAAFAMGYEPGGCGDGWAGFDVLGTVRNWTSGAWCMCGLAMKVDPGSETDDFAWKNFASWDATGGGWATPNIDIYWSEPNRAPYTPDSLSPANGHKATTTPGLSARYSDPDGNNGRLYFRVRNSSGAQVTGGWSSYVCSGCRASWGPPSLAEGVYYWETYAQDDQGATSGWSGTHSFAVDPTAPNPPSMSSSTHPDQSSWYANANATVAWSASDTSGISGYSWKLDAPADTTSEGTADSAPFNGLAEGVHAVNARAVNGTGLWSNPASFTVRVDTVKPTGPTAVTSDHAPYVASADRTVRMDWDGAVDATSGVAGYSSTFNRSYSTPADTSIDGSLTSTTSAELSDGDWYFHVRAVDRAGNVGDDKVYGPIRIDGAAALGGLTSANEAQSDQVGLEQFAPYDDFGLGTGTGYVHLGTGNAVAAFEDATVPGQGLNVVIRHTYNSQRAKIDNGLGKGWSLSVTDLDGGLDDVEGAVTDIDLNRELTPLEVGSVVDGVFQVTGFQLEFTDGDGTTHRFVRKGGPGARWDSPPGVSLRVREILDSNLLVTAYELIRPDGVVYRAERPAGLTVPSWRIVSITDRNGNQLTYTHAEVGTTTPKKVRLTDIRHNRYPTQSAATFAYDSVGHLSRITTLPGVTAADPATGTSRSWTRTIDFAVNATTGLLTSYTENTHALPAGATAATRTTSFGYDSATEVLNAMTDGRGDTTTLGYGVENGRQILTSVTDRENKAWTWTYGTVDATTGERTTTARTPLGNTTQYRISGRGPVDAPGDLRVTGGNILEIRDAGNDSGPVVDSFDWKANRLVSKTNGVGAVTTYEYNDLGLLTKVVEPAPNDPGQSAPDGAPREPITSTIEYNYPSSFRLPNCTAPATGGSGVTTEAWCESVGEMRRVALATNVAGQLRISDFAHGATGNLDRVVERGAPSLSQPWDAAVGAGDRATAFTYYTRGGLRTIDGPRTDVADVTTWGSNVATDAYGGYDRTGMPLRVQDADGKVKTLAYTPYGLTADIVDRDGNRTRNRYDERDNLVEVTDPLGRITRYTYDGNDNKATELSERSLETRYVYDGNDRLTETSEPGATATAPRGISRTTFRADGLKASSTNRAGATTTFSYHPNGSPADTVEPAEGTTTAVTSHQYDSAGRLRRTLSPAADAAGNRPVAETTYTPAGDPAVTRETAATGAAGNVLRESRTYYNAHGDPVEVQGPRRDATNNQARTTTRYDVFGQAVETRRWLDATRFLPSTVGYDLAGNQVRSTQPGGPESAPIALESTYTFDALNRLARQTKDPSNPTHEVTYRYSGEGQQTHRIDQERTASGLVDVRTTEHAFNADGTRRSTVATDHKTGAVLATCNFDDPANPAAGYDAEANLLVTHTRTGGCTGTVLRTQRFTYDDRSWVSATTQEVRAPSGSMVSRTQSFAYNPDGTRTSATHDGHTTTYELTAGAWMDAAVDWHGARTTVDYLASGAPRTIAHGTVANAAYEYAVDGMPSAVRWTKAGGTEVRTHTAVAYDVGGLRTAEHVKVLRPDGTVGEGDASYTYDLDDRLTAYTGPFKQRTTDLVNPATTYDLDRGGNMLTEVTRVGAAERSRNTSTYANGRLTQRKTTTSGDDALGVTSSTTETADFTYSVLGEEVKEQSSTVVQPVVGTSTTTNNTETTAHDPAGHVKSVDNSDTAEADVTYVYDTADRVISRTETKSGKTSTTLYFYWGSGGTLAEEADGLGRTKVRYLVDTGDEHLAQQSYKTDSSGNRDLSDTTGTWTWLLQDLSGNTGTRLKDDGSVTEQSAFDPYGRPDTGGSQKAAGDETPSTVGFQGAIQDKATGAVLLGARQYDPSSARFTTPDTFVAGALDMELGTDSLTGNRYLFAAANPVAFYEDGHWPRIKVPNPIKSAARAVKNVAKKAVPALGFVPVVGTAIDVVSAATGRDWLDGGRKLSGAERALMLGGAAAGLIPGAGIGARAAVKVAGKAVTKSKTVAKVAGAVEDVRIARKLQRHTTAAARAVDNAGIRGFTTRQQSALARPGGERLQAAFRGNRIDVMARGTVEKDAWLSSRLISKYSRGPDFTSRRTGTWFDMTTRRSWPAHLARYGGRGRFLNTHPRWYWRAI